MLKIDRLIEHLSVRESSLSKVGKCSKLTMLPEGGGHLMMMGAVN